MEMQPSHGNKSEVSIQLTQSLASTQDAIVSNSFGEALQTFAIASGWGVLGGSSQLVSG